MEVQGLWEKVFPRLTSALEAGLSVDLVADFCRVSQSTVTQWSKDQPPSGERLIRLWHLLAFIGNDSPELEQLPPLQRAVAELVAFDVVSVLEACKLFNISTKNPQHVYRILRGGEALRPVYSYDDIVALYGEELHAQQHELNAKIYGSEELTEPPVRTATVSTSVTSLDVFQAEPAVVLASLLGATLPLVRRLLADETSPEERSRFRDLLSQETLFELTNLLEQLNSERAREMNR